MVNYVCVKTAPDSTKLRLIKGPKSKFPQGACPRTALVCHMLCTQICACPPPPTLGKKLKENLTKVCVCNVSSCGLINQIHHSDLVYYTRIALET